MNANKESGLRPSTESFKDGGRGHYIFVRGPGGVHGAQGGRAVAAGAIRFF